MRKFLIALRLPVLIAVCTAVSLISPANSEADTHCWQKYSCGQNTPCLTYWANPAGHVCHNYYPAGWYDATQGTGCDYVPTSGADGCHQRTRVIPDGYGQCTMIAIADLMTLGCCSVVCPPGTPWCQPE